MAEEPGVVTDAAASDVSQQRFLVNLYKFMKEKGTPIERIPHLGFKQVNLATLYKAVEKLGGYEAVTTSRLWKNIYDELGGNPGSTSAATCTRRHYERLVLPYERHLKGEDDKPLPACKPRKQYKVMKTKDGKGPGVELKEASGKRKAAKDGAQRSSRSTGMFPPADAEDAGRGQSEGAPRDDPAPATEEPKCPGTDGTTPREVCGSPGPAGTRGGEKLPWRVPGPVVGGQSFGETDGAQRGAEELRVKGEDGAELGARCPRPVPEVCRSHLPPRREQEFMSPLAKKKLLAQGSSSQAGEVNLARPSVIQPPRPVQAEEWSPGTKIQLYPVRLGGSGGREEKGGDGRGCDHPHQPPRCLGGVQGIVKPLLHYPSKGGPFACCRGFRELGAFAMPAEKVARCYGRTQPSGDRPTDLSLPRAAELGGAHAQPHWTAESKAEPSALRLGPLAGRSPSSLEAHPKACWVPPISVALPRRVPAKRAKVDGGLCNSRPAQLLERGQKDGETPYGKKLRVVSPLHVVKEPEAMDRQAAEGKGMKTLLPVTPAWLLAAPVTQDPALAEGLRDRFPASYVLPDKEQTLYSSFIPSLALNTFMVPAMPGEGLGVPRHPLDFYKHLSAGNSYENMFRHRLYPLTTCCPTPFLSAFQVRPQL